MTRSILPGFHIAPFSVDGMPIGIAFWDYSQLSERWLRICAEFLHYHGHSFDAPWSGRLSHIETKFTCTSGAALATLSVYSTVATSLLMLSGRSMEAERQVVEMFAASLSRVGLLQHSASADAPFQGVASISMRPLLVAVPWPEPVLSEADHDVIRELGLHLAGAFFTSCFEPTS